MNKYPVDPGIRGRQALKFAANRRSVVEANDLAAGRVSLFDFSEMSHDNDAFSDRVKVWKIQKSS